MFITDSDYAVVIGHDALNTVTRADAQLRLNAELQAVEEAAAFLRPVYDVNAIFSATGPARNPLIVSRVVDIALYNLVAALPQRLGADVRKERYDRAIRWLADVRDRKINPDLPPACPCDVNDAPSSPFTTSFSANKPLRHNW